MRNAYLRDWFRKCKVAVMRHYSNQTMQCACCGISGLDFLTIDHVGGGGAAHRKSIGFLGQGGKFYRWLVKNDFPPGYQVLCYNCNLSRRFAGACPHALEG